MAIEISIVDNSSCSPPVETLSNVSPKSSKCKACFGSCLPSLQDIHHFATKLLSFGFVYATLWGLLGIDALQGSVIFALTVLVVSCYIGGKIAEFLKLPGLCGMLIVGFLFRNLPFVPYFNDIPVQWASALRNSAFVIVLLRAGLGLDPIVLKRVSLLSLRLAFIPCFVEASTHGVAAHFFMGMPFAWSFSLGFVLAAVSPAVVVPSMLILQEKGLGMDKGIPTLVLAASSFDDVLAIMGFGVAIGMAFSTGNLVWTIFKGPLEVIVGIAYGSVVGVISWYFPHHNQGRKVFYRVIILTFGGLGVSFVSYAVNLGSTGALGCLTLSFVAALKWREEPDKNLHVIDVEAGLWMILELLLFGLIGAEVSFSELKDNVGNSAIIVFIGLFFRLIATYCSLMCSPLNRKERLFVCMAWLPKATVQAAIGPVALDMALHAALPEFIGYGRKILTTSVLSIILTAPLGALGISLLAPFLLHKSSTKLEDTILNQDSSETNCNYQEKKSKSSTI